VKSTHFRAAQTVLAVVPVVVDPSVNVITGQIIGAAIEVHRILGPGLLHST
jgi:hypothetical protein